jgi:hypothetical protein
MISINTWSKHQWDDMLHIRLLVLSSCICDQHFDKISQKQVEDIARVHKYEVHTQAKQSVCVVLRLANYSRWFAKEFS